MTVTAAPVCACEIAAAAAVTTTVCSSGPIARDRLRVTVPPVPTKNGADNPGSKPPRRAPT
jgi:hypothetical protein